MNFDSYFSSLLEENAGIDQVSLIRDDASSELRLRQEVRRSFSQPNLEPPCCPKRKESNENLLVIKNLHGEEKEISSPRQIIKKLLDEVRSPKKNSETNNLNYQRRRRRRRSSMMMFEDDDDRGGSSSSSKICDILDEANNVVLVSDSTSLFLRQQQEHKKSSRWNAHSITLRRTSC